MSNRYQPVTLTTLLREDGGKNGRRYVTPEGHKYPSVTTIFSVNGNEHLDAWRERVGYEEARRISSRAAHRGTYIHSLCEKLIREEPITNINPFYKEMWVDFLPLVNQIGNVYAIEQALYSDYLKVAGTVDCVGVWKDRISVIDFKTSSRVKSESEIENYFMQCAAYAVMWEERTKQPITQLVILMAVEDEAPRIFLQHRDTWIKKFIELRGRYKELTGE